MESQQGDNNQKQRLSQISRDEIDVINDIRELNFGKINIVIQDGVIVNKEITRVVRNGKNRNRNNKNSSSSDNGYNSEEEVY